MVPHSIIELRDKMAGVVDVKEVYGIQCLKDLLIDQYKDHISFCCESGRENVVYFKEMADYLINFRYKARANTTEEESERIMAIAANLARAEIREKEYKNYFYPDPSDIEKLNWSSPILKGLLKNLAKSNTKQEFLAQRIVKATKRDVIPSL